MGNCNRCWRKTDELDFFGICSTCSIKDSIKESSKKEDASYTPDLGYVFTSSFYYFFSFIFVTLHYFKDHFKEFNIGRIWSSLIMVVLYFLYIKLLEKTNEGSNNIFIHILFKLLHGGLVLVFWVWCFCMLAFGWMKG